MYSECTANVEPRTVVVIAMQAAGMFFGGFWGALTSRFQKRPKTLQGQYWCLGLGLPKTFFSFFLFLPASFSLTRVCLVGVDPTVRHVEVEVP